MKLNARSERALKGVHPDLVAVVRKAAETTNIDFIVTEGLRTIERQKELVAKGASQTMRSRHLSGHAVDLAALVGGQVRWDWPLYDKLASKMKEAASALGIQIEWGGDWKSFKDGPHFQLPWKEYPADSHKPRGKAKPNPQVDEELQGKPIHKSKIAQGAGTVATVEAADAVTTANDVLDKVATAKETADRLGFGDQIIAVLSNPRFLIALAVILICAGIIYWRWRDHGRGG